MHRQQCRDAVETGAVPDAGRDGDHRCAGEAAEHAGECALHAGHDDQCVSVGQLVETGEQPVQAGDADVGHHGGIEPVGAQCERRLVGDGDVARARGDDRNPSGRRDVGQPPHQAAAGLDRRAVGVDARRALCRVGARQQDRSGAVGEQLADDGDALGGTLARTVDGLGHARAQVSVMVDRGAVDVGERKSAESDDGLVGRHRAGLHVVEERPQAQFVHRPIVPREAGNGPRDTNRCGRPTEAPVVWASMAPSAANRVGFFGPFGTFTQQALLSQPDLIDAEHVAYRTVPDVLDAVEHGEVDCGVVPIENSIEGMVNFTQDALAFDHDLLIQREIVIDIEHCLLAKPGVTLADVSAVYSIPVATAQCHRYLREQLPDAEIRAAYSTADAARLVSESDEVGVAALCPQVAADVYGLDVLAADIADHAGNQTRFVVVAREGVPAPTGNDKTALVIYQRADEPGSLVSILQEFTARRINLSNLTSRPTKAGGLGDYCFIVYAESHVADELLADTMRALHSKQGAVKFLGSYPAADDHAESTREHADARWREADDWVRHIQASVRR